MDLSTNFAINAKPMTRQDLRYRKLAMARCGASRANARACSRKTHFCTFPDGVIGIATIAAICTAA